MMAAIDARLEISLRIGQRVQHGEYRGKRVTGVVHGLLLDGDGVLQADIVLDAPIVIPASGEFREISIWRQHIPAHELATFDARDELIAELLDSLKQACSVLRTAERDITNPLGKEVIERRLKSMAGVIAKATGAAS